MDEELRRFLDEEAVKKVHVRYCRGVDRMDFDLIRSCYHPDATDDHGEFVGGVDEFIEYGNLTGWITASVHYIGAHEITFLNNPNLRNPAQYLVDASINLKYNKTTISVFGKNLADEQGWTIGYDVQGVWSYAAPRPPRVWGVAVTQSF